MTVTSGPRPNPSNLALSKKATPDLLARLKWLETDLVKIDNRIGRWMSTRADREDQIADVRVALRARGIVDVPK